MGLLDVRVIEFQRIKNAKGNLTPVESDRHVPFGIRRIYYLYDVPGGESRGGHAHRQLEQVMIAIAGSFDVILNDGATERRFVLNRAYQGLYVPPGLWRELENFSSGAVCLVLASAYYDEGDYVRDFDAFRRELARPV